MRVSQLAFELNIGIKPLIECIQALQSGEYTSNSNLSQDIVDYVLLKYPVEVRKEREKPLTTSQKINKLIAKVNFHFKFRYIEKEDDVYSFKLHGKLLLEINQLKDKKDKYAQLDDSEILKLIQSKVKLVVKIQKALKKAREYNDLLNSKPEVERDRSDFSTPFDNPWNNVFGYGQEAYDAYWNTD